MTLPPIVPFLLIIQIPEILRYRRKAMKTAWTLTETSTECVTTAAFIFFFSFSWKSKCYFFFQCFMIHYFMHCKSCISSYRPELADVCVKMNACVMVTCRPVFTWGFSDLVLMSHIVLSFLQPEKEAEKILQESNQNFSAININFINKLISLLLPNVVTKVRA